jgi:hypothetical protein
MIGHQTIGYDIDQVRMTIIPESSNKEGPILQTKEDRLLVNAAVIDMIVIAG